jgi:hypothetical protein
LIGFVPNENQAGAGFERFFQSKMPSPAQAKTHHPKYLSPALNPLFFSIGIVGYK